MLRSQQVLQRKKKDHGAWNTKGGEPEPSSGNLYTGNEKWLPRRLHHLFPPAVLLKRFILKCSIFKVTAWFHIHNHSCMNVQFHFRPWTNHLLSPRILPRSRCIDWSVSYLPRAALFQIWKQTLADWTLPFSLIFCLFLYFTSYSLLLLSHPGIIRQGSEGIIAAPSLLVEVTAVLSITMGHEWLPWRLKVGNMNELILVRNEKGGAGVSGYCSFV